MVFVLQIAAKINSNPVAEEASALKRPFEGSSGIVMQPVWTDFSLASVAHRQAMAACRCLLLFSNLVKYAASVVR